MVMLQMRPAIAGCLAQMETSLMQVRELDPAPSKPVTKRLEMQCGAYVKIIYDYTH
jgi:hypothetical protein